MNSVLCQRLLNNYILNVYSCIVDHKASYSVYSLAPRPFEEEEKGVPAAGPFFSSSNGLGTRLSLTPKLLLQNNQAQLFQHVIIF